VGLVAQKLIALYLGPGGLAIVGNLRNLLGISNMVSTLGVDQGLLSNQSKYQNQPPILKQLYETSKIYALIGTVFLAVLLVVGNQYISLLIFNTVDYGFLLIVLALSLPFMALYNLVLSVANGNSDFKKVTKITVIAHVTVALMLILFVLNFQLSGALWALILTPVVQLITLLFFARPEILVFLSSGWHFHKQFSKTLLIFIMMAFAAVLMKNTVDLALRNHLIISLGSEDAGYWTSMTNLSNYYLSILTGFYSLYVMPRFAKITSFKAFTDEVLLILRFIIPVFLVGFTLIYVFRRLIIVLLFSEEFAPMSTLFVWQLAGDFVKIIAMIIAYNLIVKQMWRLFIVSEILSSLLFYALGEFFMKSYGLEGVVMAHLLRYALYLIFVLSTAKIPFKKPT
jgi:PST family polysaccharide transporter